MALTSLPTTIGDGDIGELGHTNSAHENHNKLKAALDAAATGGLIGADANSDPAAFDPSPANISSGFTKTVGTGGDYSTIPAALEDLSKRFPVHAALGWEVELRILDGFTMSDFVKIDNVDLGWIRITYEPVETGSDPNAEVTVDTNLPTDGAFFAERNATLPIIDCFFRASTDAGSGSALFQAYRDSHIEFGANGGGGGPMNRILQVIYGGLVTATSGLTLDGGGSAGTIGLRCANGGKAAIPFSTITDCPAGGIAAASGAIVQCVSATLSGPDTKLETSSTAVVVANDATLTGGGNAVNSAGGVVYVKGADCTDSTILAQSGATVIANDVTLGSTGSLRVLDGAQIIGTGHTGGSLTQVANVWTEDGIIIDTAAVSQNWGFVTFDGDGSTTTFDIPHGLDAAPANGKFWVMPANGPTAASGPYHVAADATNVSVTLQSAPASGTSNVRFHWNASR